MESLTVKLYVHIIRYQWTSQKTFHNKVVFIIVCIKHFEGLHGFKDAPYVGYGHQLLPGEHFTAAMTERQADSLLRADLMKRLMMFKDYGKDALLLAILSYNVGTGRLISDTANIPRADYCGR